MENIIKKSDSVTWNIFVEYGASGISIDSRTISNGECYIALKGDRCDGHDFVDEAVRKGAVCAVVDKAYYNRRAENSFSDELKKKLIPVNNTYDAFCAVAADFRKRHDVKCVGITGSCGKTTTKELCAHVLAQKFVVSSTKGNFNNHIGVPLTLLGLKQEDQVLVCEMGASHKGDIFPLAELADPDVGIITNVFPSHLSGFGSIDAIYRTKLELGEYLDRGMRTLIVNGDDKYLVQEARKLNVSLVTFGKNNASDFAVTDSRIAEEGTMFTVNGKYNFFLPTIAPQMVENAVASLALADYFGMDLKSLENIFNEFTFRGGRFEIMRKAPLIINDAYNASPVSFRAALQIFKKIRIHGKKIVVAGDMRELGDFSYRYHYELARHIIDSGINLAVLVGNETWVTYKALEECNHNGIHVHLSSNEDVIAFLRGHIKKADAVLIKGSRGNKLDEVVAALV